MANTTTNYTTLVHGPATNVVDVPSQGSFHPLQDLLFLAAKEGDHAQIKILLESGANINGRDEVGK